MSIRVQCPNPSCGAIHKVKSRYAGKRCLCPSCGQPFQVAEPVADATPAPVAPAAPAVETPVMPVLRATAPAPASPPAPTPPPASIPVAAPVAAPVVGKVAGHVPVAAPVSTPVRGPVPVAAPVAPPAPAAGTAAPAESAPLKIPVLELTPRKQEPPPRKEADDDLAAFLDAVREEEANGDSDGAVVLDAADDEEVVLKDHGGRDNGRVAPAEAEDDLAAFLNAVEEEEKEATAAEVVEADEVEDALVVDEIEEDSSAAPASDAEIVDAELTDEDVVDAELAGDDDVVDAELADDDVVDAELADDEPLMAEVAEDDEEEEEEDEDEKLSARPHFLWTAVIFLLLGTLAVYALVGVPFVGGTSKIRGTGDFGKAPPNAVTRGFGELPKDLQTALWGVPAAMGTLALLGVLLAIVSRRFDGLNMVLVYLAAILTAAYTLLAGMRYEATVKYFEGSKKTITSLYPQGGELSLQLAPHLWLGLIASAAALLLLGVGLLLMHRRLWARLVFLFLFLAVVGGIVYTALNIKIQSFSV